MRLKYHFEPRKGWINDPNGLIKVGGRYHAFFQHTPYSPYWDKMHWGHAVSDDLVRWEELPIALYPDQPYENSGGCFSGTSIVKDGRLYLFYASVSEELHQTVSIAYSDDGVKFTKYERNPVIAASPDGSHDFRDPKIFRWGGGYRLLVGSGKDKLGRIFMYSSDDLFSWEYTGVLFESADYPPVIECPDFFELDGKYVLMFSRMAVRTHATVFITGSFDGERFTPEQLSMPECGPQFYAPQTFDDGGRRIMIGWIYSRDRKPEPDADYNCALSIPRELHVVDGCVTDYPVAEAAPLLTATDPLVKIADGCVTVGTPDYSFSCGGSSAVILRDTKVIEVFADGGKRSFTYWLA